MVLYIVVQAVGANTKSPLYQVNSAYNSLGSSGHCSNPVFVAKCYRSSETRMKNVFTSCYFLPASRREMAKA